MSSPLPRPSVCKSRRRAIVHTLHCQSPGSGSACRPLCPTLSRYTFLCSWPKSATARVHAMMVLCVPLGAPGLDARGWSPPLSARAPHLTHFPERYCLPHPPPGPVCFCVPILLIPRPCDQTPTPRRTGREDSACADRQMGLYPSSSSPSVTF